VTLDTTAPEYGTAGNGRGALSKIKDEVKFYQHQIDGVRHLARLNSFLLADEMGGGKAQPIDRPVLCPEGWRPIGALQPGDVICRPSGGMQRVAAVHPQGVTPVARVSFSDGTSTVASWDHLWTVLSDADGWVDLTTTELHDAGVSTPDGRHRWRLPMPVATAQTGALWPDQLDPMAAGFAYAGGFTFENKRSDFACFKASTKRYPSLEHLTVPDTLLSFENKGLAPDDQRPEALTAFYQNLEALGFHRMTTRRKFPEWLMFESIATRTLFLSGAMLAVGGIGASTGWRFGLDLFYSTNANVVEGFASLARSLGIGATVDGTFIHMDMPHYWHSVTGVSIDTPFPSKYVTQISPAGESECCCITVDDSEGLYLTNGYTVTHNSLQVLAVTAVDYQLGNASKTLIVCPATLKDNWASEIAEHTAFKAVVCQGTPKKREAIIEDFRTDPDTDILIMNYEQVPGHLDAINACVIDVLIFDEAHYLKNPKSKRTKACHNIFSKRSFLLTGSPMLNQPDELWGILHRINPHEFPSYWRFREHFCKMGGFQGKQVTGVKNRLELVEILDRYMLRRLKSEMIQLPPKNYVPVHVPLSPLQTKLYKQATDELQLEVPGNPDPMELENAMTKMLRLKQITGTPATLGFEDESVKLDRAVEIAAQLIEDGEKVVIFTQFRGVLEAMVTRLAAIKVPVYQMHGDVPQKLRVPLVHEWRDAPAAGALVAMLQVAGVGLDFTAASNMIFLDKLYVPDMNTQAEDRCHRLSMNKTKPVTIYEMLCTGTVEDRVEKILRRKRKLGKEVVDATELKKIVAAALHDRD
jgi:superfamily II DNA or RNA helicase